MLPQRSPLTTKTHIVGFSRLVLDCYMCAAIDGVAIAIVYTSLTFNY